MTSIPSKYEQIRNIAFTRKWHNDPHGDIACFDIEEYRTKVLTLVEQLQAEHDAWKILHDSRGKDRPYGYASQEQLQEIRDAQKVLGI